MKKFFLLIIFPLIISPAYLFAQTDEYVAKADSDGVQRIQITAAAYFFTPKNIVVKVNVPVELSVKKEAGMVPHNITLSAPDAGMDFSESLAAEGKAITFTPTKVGKYVFFCNKKLPFSKSHREKGMEGILEVRE